MLIECWAHLGKLLINIKPLLSTNQKATVDMIIVWGFEQDDKYFGIDLGEIEWVKTALTGIGQQFTGQSRTDLITAINFLNTLNKNNPPEIYQTLEGCVEHEYNWKDNKICVLKDAGYFPPIPPKPGDIKNESDCLAMNWYWYNGICNVSPLTPEACKNYSECIRQGWYWYDNTCHYTPEPPVPVPLPSDYKTKTTCVAAGFYWYDSACHEDPQPEPAPIPIPAANQFLVYASYLDEYLKTLSVLKVIERGIVVLLANWLRLIGNFLIWIEKRGT